MAVVQHGHHGVHAPEHLGQNLVLVGQGQAGRDRLGEGVIPLVRRRLTAAGNTDVQTPSLVIVIVIVSGRCHDADSLLHQPVLDSRVPLRALLRLLLLGSSLGFGCELFGSSQRRTERLGVADRSFGWFASTRPGVVSCRSSRGGRRRCCGDSDRSITGFLPALLNPLETRLESCNVVFAQALEKQRKSQIGE